MKANNEPVAVAKLAPSVELQADQFILKKDVLRLVGFSHATLYRRIKAGNFPAQIRLKGSCDNSPSVWSLMDVIAWQEDQKRGGAK